MIELMRPLVLTNMLSGLIFMLAGFILSKYPPKKINSLYGYRTGRSIKSKEAWDFAQGYSADKIFRTGWWLILISIACGFIPKLEPLIELLPAIGILLIFSIIPIVQTEKELKRRFG